MSKEIERKFLVDTSLIDLVKENKVDYILDIQQGYIDWETEEDSFELRIRIVDNKVGYLTIKQGQGLIRDEYESFVDEGNLDALYRLLDTTPYRVYKKRAVVGRWEIDFFQKDLSDLILAEVELDSKDEDLPQLPNVVKIIKEVTEHPSYSNYELARRNS